MKIHFLETSQDGLRWMLRYYENVFPAGRKNGLMNYQNAKRLLRDNPFGGHEFDKMQDIREMRVVKTPFSIIYTVQGETIYVIDIRDQRGIRSFSRIERAEG